MSGRSIAFRRLRDRVMRGLMLLSVLLVMFPLFSMLYEVVLRGLPALSLDFLFQLPKPVGEAGGGWGNAIQGSFIVVGLASMIGLPIGIFTGVYLSEYGDGSLGRSVRFLADVMTGIPSIVAGIFGYSLVVLRMGRFSAIAGGVALSLIIIPIVARTTEEALRLVPLSFREASLALGIRRWITIIRVVMPAGAAGILTGFMLALARIFGETAPLLFTSFGNRFWATGIDQPIATLPVQIFTYGISPFPEWQAQAWAGSLILAMIVLGLSLAVRLMPQAGRGRAG